ncbi:unnamed protein product [Clavelina lepadiformis]|uniref:Uncharacterized protein n=1 Tax=Clavelina lepadiformis TaxID=159417 RepID=A0ABP0FGF9_CLALP
MVKQGFTCEVSGFHSVLKVNVTDFGYSENDKISFINDLLLGRIEKEALIDRVSKFEVDEQNAGFSSGWQQHNNKKLIPSSGVARANEYVLRGVFVGTMDSPTQESNVYVVPIPKTEKVNNLKLEQGEIAPFQVVDSLFCKLNDRKCPLTKGMLHCSQEGSRFILEKEKRERKQTKSIEPGMVRRIREKFSSKYSSTESGLTDHNSVSKPLSNLQISKENLNNCKAKITCDAANSLTHEKPKPSKCKGSAYRKSLPSNLTLKKVNGNQRQSLQDWSTYQQGRDGRKRNSTPPPSTGFSPNSHYDSTTSSSEDLHSNFTSNTKHSMYSKTSTLMQTAQVVRGSCTSTKTLEPTVSLGRCRNKPSVRRIEPEKEFKPSLSSPVMMQMKIGSRTRSTSTLRCPMGKYEADNLTAKRNDNIDTALNFHHQPNENLEIGVKSRRLRNASSGPFQVLDEKRNNYRSTSNAVKDEVFAQEDNRASSPGPRCVDQLEYPFSDSTTEEEKEVKKKWNRSTDKNNKEKRKKETFHNSNKSNVSDESLGMNFEELKKEHRMWHRYRRQSSAAQDYIMSEEHELTSHPDERRQAYDDRVRQFIQCPPPIKTKTSVTLASPLAPNTQSELPKYSKKFASNMTSDRARPLVASDKRNKSNPIDIEYDNRKSRRSRQPSNHDFTSDEDKGEFFKADIGRMRLQIMEPVFIVWGFHDTTIAFVPRSRFCAGYLSHSFKLD